MFVIRTVSLLRYLNRPRNRAVFLWPWTAGMLEMQGQFPAPWTAGMLEMQGQFPAPWMAGMLEMQEQFPAP